MDVVIEATTGGDPALPALVAAQEQEVMARYGVDDAGPRPAPDAAWFVARLAGRPVGCVALGSLGDGVGEVERMYVDPTARGRGVARLLLQRLEEESAARGDRLLRLETGTGQPEALRLYRSAGWREIPCYGYFRDDPTTICLEKATAG